jgi:hypothetical protein
MSNKLPLALINAALLVALAACASGTPVPTETVAPTPTPQPEPTTPPAGEGSLSLSDADQAYMKWLANLHRPFEATSGRLIELWQASQEEGPGKVPEGSIEEMEALVAELQDYVEEVESREDVPQGVSEIHAVLLNEVHHWENAAPLLVESVTALDEGDREQFHEVTEEADTELRAAVEARQELLDLARRLLEALQEESN